MADYTARGTFDVTLSPAEALIANTARFDFTKVWFGDLVGESVGSMLSAGDPGAGSAGYVAIESVRCCLAGRDGSFAFIQRGLLADGEATLTYDVAPGSGAGDLAGITGTLVVDPERGHAWVLEYQLPH